MSTQHLILKTITPETFDSQSQTLGILTFDFMDKTLTCNHSLESCGAVLYCGVVCSFKFYPVCNFGKFINFGLGSVSEVKVLSSNYDQVTFPLATSIAFTIRGVMRMKDEVSIFQQLPPTTFMMCV